MRVAADLLHVLGSPEGDGGSPVSITGDVPVSCVLEPISESVLSDILGDPENRMSRK